MGKIFVFGMGAMINFRNLNTNFET